MKYIVTLNGKNYEVEVTEEDAVLLAVTEAAAVAPVAAPAPVAATASSDEEIVAAITAAITLMREAEGSTGTFRVVSFRRTGGARPWNQA